MNHHMMLNDHLESIKFKNCPYRYEIVLTEPFSPEEEFVTISI